MDTQKKNPPPEAASDGEEKLKYSRQQVTTTEKQPQTLIDRHGHAHSEAVLRHWSPALLKAMRIRRIEPERPSGGAK